MPVRGRDLLRPPRRGVCHARVLGGETFYGTLTFRRFLVFPAQSGAGSHPLCARDGAPLGAALSSYIECDVSFLDTALNPPAGLRVVRCTASASLEFSRTPLAWAIPWSPTIGATAEAIPPP